MGKSTKRCGFSWSSGSGANPLFSAILCFDGFSDRSEVFSAFLVLGAEFFPVVSIVVDEVGDFTKSLVLYGHVLV